MRRLRRLRRPGLPALEYSGGVGLDRLLRAVGQALGGEVLGEVALHLERVVLVSFSITWLKLISRTVPGS